LIQASIDLGTNTALLLIRECLGKPTEAKVLTDRSTMVRLGQGVDKTGMLDTEAMSRTISCLKEYVKVAEQSGVSPGEIVAVSTATARDAKNGREFFERVQAETGIHFRTLSGEEEARASFLGGLLPGMKPEESLLFDLGGGSLEFQTQTDGLSLQMGSVRFTERYLKTNPVTDTEFWACEEAIDSELLPLKSRFKALNLVGVAGTVVTLGAVHLGLESFDRSALDGLVLTRGDVHRMVEDLKWRNREERLLLPGMEKGREDVILAGALIVWRIMEVLSFREMTVSTRGLRYGVLPMATH
jgi:exopolyphosphatase / guanosine-5'-triphosphate,3'-diphosphate pyrophosphatase